MKRIICLILVCATALAPFCMGSVSASGELGFDAVSPFSYSDGVLTLDRVRTASEVVSAFVGDAAVTSASGAALTGGDAVSTGAVVSPLGGGDKVSVVLPGDVDASASINARDVYLSMRFLAGSPDGGCEAAIDADANGVANGKDVVKLMRYLVGWDETLGAVRTDAENDDPELGMYFDSILHRVAREDTTVHGESDGMYYCAKNELEDAQIILTSTEQKDGLTLEIGALANRGGGELSTELRYGYYYDMAMFNDLKTCDYGNYTSGFWADPFPKLNGQSFAVGKNESQCFMVQVDVPADAEAGWYCAPVTVRDSEGREVKKAALRFYVWDFALDEETACDTLFLTWSYGLASYYGRVYPGDGYTSSEIWNPIYVEKFYDFMLKNRISGYNLPYDILDSRVDRYLDDPRVTSFCSIGGMGEVDLTSDGDRARLRAVYDKLETNPVWAEKAYIYTVDEPYYEEGAELVRAQWTNAKSVLGDTPFKTVLPFGNNYLSGKGVDQLDYLWDYCNAFCPSEGVFTPCEMPNVRKEDRDRFPEWGEYMANAQFKKYGDFQPRYEQLRERGNSMWWYVCCSPQYPYANFFNYYQGDWTRVVLWIQYLLHADGLLYWNTSAWTVDEHDPRLITLKRTNTGGDGLLVYDGMLWDREAGPEPVPTCRFEAVRDGIEDFQYLKQLERIIGENGRDEMLSRYVTRLATDVTHFSQDYRFMEQVRAELGFELELACKGAN